MLILKDPLCDCGKKACRPGSYGSHKALLLEQGSRRSLAGQGFFWGERAGFLGQFFAHIGHQRPCKLSFNCSPPNRLLLLYPLSLNRCFSHAMVGSFQRTTIRKLETIPMTSDWGNIRQITGHSEDGLFHSH